MAQQPLDKNGLTPENASRSTLIIFAHPQLQISRANRALIEAAHEAEHVAVHDIYEVYPDMHLRVRPEQMLLEKYDVILFQFPLQWYAPPALLKEYMDIVLQRGWAYGDDEHALEGKIFGCITSAAGTEESFSAEGYNRYPLQTYLSPLEQTALLCRMACLEHYVIYDAAAMSDTRLKKEVKSYAAYLDQLTNAPSDELPYLADSKTSKSKHKRPKEKKTS
jgi:glutathione-regulated potassium-efflux system ancillary protein KefF